MSQPSAHRTIVKSPPELWAELSDAEALARHLGEFGEIRITRLEHEATVAWEGDRACGTVALEPAGWGTKVTLTAELEEKPAADAEVTAGPAPAPAEAPAEPPQPAADPQPESEPPEPEPRRRGFFARLFGRRRARPEEPAAPSPPVAVAPEPEPEPEPEPPPAVPDEDEGGLGPERAEAILTAVLDDLGTAHHRPFSRS